MKFHFPESRRRGVALIEAAVAVAVMSIGILALVGVQGRLRFNSDLSRQRVDAVRIAAQDLESLRFFASLAAVAGQANPSWSEIASYSNPSFALPGGANNATYAITRSVLTSDAASGPQRKLVEVAVSWNDRSDVLNTIKLNGVIAAVEPSTVAALSAPPGTPPFSRRSGRAMQVPVAAVPLYKDGVLDNTSAFKPSPSATVVWRFDNTTGYITSVCTGVATAQANITAADLTSCSTVDGRLVSGTVQFDLSANPSAQTPAGPALPLESTTASTGPLRFDPGWATTNTGGPLTCYANSPASLAEGKTRTAIQYYCLVVVGTQTPKGWGGKVDVNPAALTSANDASGWSIPITSAGRNSGNYQVCRYTAHLADNDGEEDYVPNAFHPKYYCDVTKREYCFARVTESLINQNFLVIRGNQSCPADASVVTGTSTLLVNYNTWQHQPSP